MNLLNELIQHFTLPALQKTEGTELHDWRWEGTNIVLEVFIPGQDEEYLYSLTADIRDFRVHCEAANEIPKNGFCEWFEGLSWTDKQVEAETFANKFLAEIKADYAAWKGNAVH